MIERGKVVEGKETRVGKEEGPRWHSPWDPRSSWEIEGGMVAACCKKAWSTWGS